MYTYTIYRLPADLPGAEFAVRRFEVTGSETIAGPLMGVADSLEEARLLVPVECVCFGRDASDDLAIVETWL